MTFSLIEDAIQIFSGFELHFLQEVYMENILFKCYYKEMKKQ